jgi:hypothetical protein
MNKAKSNSGIEKKSPKDEKLSEPLRQKLFNEIQGVASNCTVNPSFSGATALQKFSGCEDANSWDVISALADQGKNVNNGDLKTIESVLTVQIHILNHMFNKLALRAMRQEHLKLIESFMRIALKAQNQCRITAETLSNMKNPQPATFVKQANIGYNQQVNNSSLPESSSLKK